MNRFTLLILLSLLFPTPDLFSQTDTLFREGANEDTIILKKEPVIIVQNYVLEERSYKEVNNFFYVRPFISYLLFYNDYHKNKNMLAEAYCFSVKEKPSYNVGIDLGYKIKKYNLLVGYTYFRFNEEVYNYKADIFHNNYYTQHHISAKLLYDINFKKIYVSPYGGISYKISGTNETVYPFINQENKIEFNQNNNFQSTHNFYFLSGIEFRFLNSKHISPYINVGFMKGIHKDGFENKSQVVLNRYVFTGSAGLLLKF